MIPPAIFEASICWGFWALPAAVACDLRSRRLNIQIGPFSFEWCWNADAIRAARERRLAKAEG